MEPSRHKCTLTNNPKVPLPSLSFWLVKFSIGVVVRPNFVSVSLDEVSLTIVVAVRIVDGPGSRWLGEFRRPDDRKRTGSTGKWKSNRNLEMIFKRVKGNTEEEIQIDN